MELPILPTINACLNATAAVLLFLGWRFIKKGDREAHRKCMMAAVGVSSIFLACYLYYHYTHEETKFAGVGFIRTIYFLILIPHVILATAMVPFVFTALWFARKQQFEKHRKVTRILWPVWMYVSVTGVIIYLMLYVLY